MKPEDRSREPPYLGIATSAPEHPHCHGRLRGIKQPQQHERARKPATECSAACAERSPQGAGKWSEQQASSHLGRPRQCRPPYRPPGTCRPMGGGGNRAALTRGRRSATLAHACEGGLAVPDRRQRYPPRSTRRSWCRPPSVYATSHGHRIVCSISSPRVAPQPNTQAPASPCDVGRARAIKRNWASAAKSGKSRKQTCKRVSRLGC